MTSILVAFLLCQSLVVLFIAVHDWVPLGRLNNLRGVHAADGTTRLFVVTVLSTLPFAVGLAGTLYYSSTRNPGWLSWWLWISYGLGIYGMFRAWYWPYLFGGDPARVERYRQRFANTHAFLPVRNGFRPDTLHVCFHAVYACAFVLLAVLTFRNHAFVFN
jgi:hypothetical protein